MASGRFPLYNLYRCRQCGVENPERILWDANLSAVRQFILRATQGKLPASWKAIGSAAMCQRLLPAVYVRSDGHATRSLLPAALPIEIITFEGS